jgi:hypothetical protein
MKINKLIFTISLEIIFTVILILSLVFIRQEVLASIQDIQLTSAVLANVNENLNESQKADLIDVTKDVNSSIDRLSLLIYILLPLFLLILPTIFYYVIWNSLNKTKIKNYLWILVPLIFLLASIIFLLNELSFIFSVSTNSSLVFFIISVILTLVTYYLFLVLVSSQLKLKQLFIFSLKKLHKLIIQFILIIITTTLYIFLVFWLFFLNYVQASIIIQAILMLILIAIINLQRLYFYKKVVKLI